MLVAVFFTLLGITAKSNDVLRRSKRFGQSIKTVDCARGMDQAAPNEWKYLVLPEFPDKYFKPTKCEWAIKTSAGSRIQVVIKEMSMQCAGGNKLLISEGTKSTKPICGNKKYNKITSQGESLTFKIQLNQPGRSGSRVQIGFFQVNGDDIEGFTIHEFNLGKKLPTIKPRTGPAGGTNRKFGNIARLKVAGPGGRGGGPGGPGRGGGPGGPGARGGPKKKPERPFQEMANNPPPRNYVSSVRTGSLDRWEKIDRRPILIGGGVVFLLLMIGVTYYIGKVCQQDREEQEKLRQEGGAAINHKINTNHLQLPEKENSTDKSEKMEKTESKLP